MKILIVDDDPTAIMVLDAMLRQLGHQPEVATDGQQGWEKYLSLHPGVVISDWVMPGLDGLELCRRIRGHGGDYSFFVLVSQRTTATDNLKLAVEAGVDDFLQKPVRQEDLWLRLRMAERILNYDREVRHLEEFIPICSYCKKVRDDKNYWEQIEQYINTRTGSNFSHSVCPDCYNRVVVPQMNQIGAEVPPHPQVKRVT